MYCTALGQPDRQAELVALVAAIATLTLSCGQLGMLVAACSPMASKWATALVALAPRRSSLERGRRAKAVPAAEMHV